MSNDHGFEIEFEFCRVAEPGASPNAPADHLFSNGRLVPHDFPCSPKNIFKSLSRSENQRSSSFGSFSSCSHSLSRSGSQRSSSFGSSSSSGSDSCSWSQRSSSSISSCRTSISDASAEKPEFFHAIRAEQTRKPYKARKHDLTRDNGSQKWQFIAPVSVLNGNVRHRSKKSSQRKKSEVADHQKVLKSKNEEKSKGLWRRFLCLFVSTCNEFHAIEPSVREY
ncbi:hypothetical protein DCAR_0522383 [Daucus carota subsp. sativus]|uniref:Uncharacterized protein n=1 Tax=Daucus carota subsp. sativus TaxID=79200 RepID=A0A164ZS38_DAUCS|nr:PREDICTED: uncharacterized protein LOC108221846 [Daucus carota subsp. sativus]WOH02993.1 hypothetical protein DCAR_0522383 [Daucus carota subsp. sativus]